MGGCGVCEIGGGGFVWGVGVCELGLGASGGCGLDEVCVIDWSYPLL